VAPWGAPVSAAQVAFPDEPYRSPEVPALQVVREARKPDVAAATRAARALLEALGLDTAAEGMVDTPGRMARAVADLLAALGQDPASEQLADTPRRVAAGYAELLTPAPFTLTTFPNDEGYDELVLARAIPLRSVCEHHLLPFTGVAHVGYLPGDRILGLSKLARLVEHYAARPQVQERLTQQVADWLYRELDAQGVGVVLEAEHTCMTLRGVQAVGARTVTSALRGVLRDSPSSRAEFFSLTGVPH
jgi:GTP cyclohydrolase I